MIAAEQRTQHDGRGVEVDVPGAGAPNRRFTLGRAVILLVLGALVVWIGMRVRTATKTQAAIAEEGVKAAKAGETAEAAKVTVVSPMERMWTPEVPLEGTLAP